MSKSNDKEVAKPVQVVDEDVDDDETCGFCIYMKGGGCKAEFVAWSKCVDSEKAQDKDFTEECREKTLSLQKCMEEHRDYYHEVMETAEVIVGGEAGAGEDTPKLAGGSPSAPSTAALSDKPQAEKAAKSKPSDSKPAAKEDKPKAAQPSDSKPAAKDAPKAQQPADSKPATKEDKPKAEPPAASKPAPKADASKAEQSKDSKPADSGADKAPPKGADIKAAKGTEGDTGAGVQTEKQSQHMAKKETPPEDRQDDQVEGVEAVKAGQKDEEEVTKERPEAEAGGDKDGEGGDEEEEEEPPIQIKLESAPYDRRFPATNQARHCYTRYNEYHKCIAEKGEEDETCSFYQRAYRSICPSDWILAWNEARDAGTWPGRY